ncbi:GALA protein 4 [Enhygromyxa salina]|uniref:GALA protein 4 n=1 Tax=Enhygromyxa salina TaxID=215803 RepID=A0A0C2DDD2_9BACT|nr:TIGR02996 domain-containing protein [Enhygromyxa salina]KIG19455.1 GALA protein 4 [Enhygromyxa salina]
MDALLDAIAAAPESDAERLVYADWLLESGDRLDALGELGELIVAQISQHTRPDDPDLNRRVAQLISTHQSKVLGDLPLSKPVFRRGFVEAAEISALDFTQIETTLFERLPLLTELVVWLEEHGANKQLYASPSLGRLRTLSFRYGRNADVRTLASNPAIAQLQSLAWIGCQLGASGCQALANSPHLGSLRALEIGSDAIGLAGTQALSRAAFAPQLTTLRLWKAGLGPDMVDPLRAFVALETLELGYNELTARDVAAIANITPKIRSLSLRGNRIGAEAVPALAPLMLSHLDLDRVKIGDAGISRLAELELGQLDTLNLEGNELSAAGVQRLVELPLPKLRLLMLRGNELGRGARLLEQNLRATRVELDGMVLVPGR